MAAKVKNYQGLVFFAPTLSEEAVDREITTLAALFPEGAAEVKNLGLKNFVYPIKKETRGFHVRCRVSGDTTSLERMEQTLKGNPAVLRYLITYAPREPKPKAKAETLKKEDA